MKRMQLYFLDIFFLESRVVHLYLRHTFFTSFSRYSINNSQNIWSEDNFKAIIEKNFL